jgi:hypothetical protein
MSEINDLPTFHMLWNNLIKLLNESTVSIIMKTLVVSMIIEIYITFINL